MGGSFSDRESTAGAWSPAVDIYETKTELVLKAEISEIDKKDLDVQVEDNVLTVKGERKLYTEDKRENYHRIERPYGRFSRSFALPNSLDANHIAANYKDGVLTITIPKREETKPSQISITVK